MVKGKYDGELVSCLCLVAECEGEGGSSRVAVVSSAPYTGTRYVVAGGTSSVGGFRQVFYEKCNRLCDNAGSF